MKQMAVGEGRGEEEKGGFCLFFAFLFHFRPVLCYAQCCVLNKRGNITILHKKDFLLSYLLVQYSQKTKLSPKYKQFVVACLNTRTNTVYKAVFFL